MLARIPFLVQLIVADVLILVCLGVAGLARLTDAWGWNGGTRLFAPVDAVAWGAMLAGLVLLVLLLRQIWRPRVQEVSWSPVRHFGSLMVVAPGDPWATKAQVLTNHPCYVLLDLVAGVLPLFLVMVSWNDLVQYHPAIRLWHWGLAVWACIPLARLLCWYVLRRRPDLGASAAKSAARRKELEWELAWKPTLAFWAIALAVTLPAVAVAFSVDKETDPPLDATTHASIVADTLAHEEKRFRITGEIIGELKEWPREGALHPAAGVLLKVPGGEAVLVCTVHDLGRMKQNVAGAKDGRLSCTARVMQPLDAPVRPAQPVSMDTYRTQYHWRIADFGPVPEGTTRLLLRWVDP